MLFKLSLWAYALLAIPALTSPTSPLQPRDDAFNASTIDVQILTDPLPYYFPPQAAMGTPALFPMETCNGFVIEEAAIDDLQGAMEKGIFTALELASCFLR